MGFLTRLYWYNRLVAIDVRRRWLLSAIHVFIVAGICIPILILSGLKRGLVTDLKEDLVTSPVGRQVIFWSARSGAILTDELVDSMQSELPGVEIIIPDVEVNPSLSHRGDSARIESLTVASTLPGDPVLDDYKVEVPAGEQKEIVLPRWVASRLNAEVGATAELTLFRHNGEEATIEFTVKGIYGKEVDEDNPGFAHLEITNLMARYVKGFAVPHWGLPAMKEFTAPDKYASYLLICKKSDDLQKTDRQILEETYEVERVTDVQTRKLFGILNDRSLEDLLVYRVSTVGSRSDPRFRMSIDPFEIDRDTSSDEVIVPWNPPRIVTVDGKPCMLVGRPLTGIKWLRRYLFDPELIPQDNFEEFMVQFLNDEPMRAADKVNVNLGNHDVVTLAVRHSSAKENGEQDKEPEEKAPGSTPGSDEKQKPAAKESIPEDDSDKAEPEDDKAAAGKVVDETIGNEVENKNVAKSDDGAKEANKGGKPVPEKDPSPVGNAPREGGSGKTVTEQPAAESLSKENGYKANVNAQPPPKKATKEDRGNGASPNPLTGVVPMHFLAHVDAYKNGLAVFDPVQHRFVPPPDKPKYGKARLYTKTIDEVDAVVSELHERRFGHDDEDQRIDEIKEQEASLDLLVTVVTYVVFVFGVATVAIVLLDSTNRKRKEIGILRIMGVSPPAVWYMVMQRAAIIGVFATLLAGAFGFGTCWLLSWEPEKTLSPGGYWMENWSWLIDAKPTANAFLDWREDWRIVAIALACSLLGSFIPGVLAGRLDPFDAVVQAKDS